MDFPLEKIKSAEAGFRVRVAGSYALGLFPGARPDHVYPQLAVGAWAGEEYSPGLVLLLHPDQVLVKTDGLLLTRTYGPTMDQIPHGYLLRISMGDFMRSA